jgi:hypothetical protein
MKLIEAMKGKGTGVSKNRRCPVDYDLTIQEPDNEVAPPGTREIEGRVFPRFGERGETLILEMQDGRRLSFSYVGDEEGFIVAKGPLFATFGSIEKTVKR